jgi:hypothetical protein
MSQKQDGRAACMIQDAQERACSNYMPLGSSWSGVPGLNDPPYAER